jgi:hypothetical protein
VSFLHRSEEGSKDSNPLTLLDKEDAEMYRNSDGNQAPNSESKVLRDREDDQANPTPTPAPQTIVGGNAKGGDGDGDDDESGNS